MTKAPKNLDISPTGRPYFFFFVVLVTSPQARRFWCAEHGRQLGGETPLHNLMEVRC